MIPRYRYRGVFAGIDTDPIPLIPVTVFLTLTLCIGATTDIFTVVRSVLLRPLPYPDSDRLVTVFEAYPGTGIERSAESVPNDIDRLAFTDVFDSQALYQFNGVRVGQGTSGEGITTMNVTPSCFRVLRVTAARGRAQSGRFAGTERGRRLKSVG